ncbi:MAG: DUF429 domain-containing protein [Actinomycetota bacterium]
MHALGVDVSVSRGLDLVLLDESEGILDSHRRVPAEKLPEFLEPAPDVVAIDAPPGWGTNGGSRLTERELRRFGIQSFGTPSESQSASAFYDWMRVGITAFKKIAGPYPRYRSGRVAGTAIEVFPHATAVVLAQCLPPKGAKKHRWRRDILSARGIDGLRSADQVDAALAALTGILALRGRFTALGDPLEGVIVVPSRTLPPKPFRRCVDPGEDDDQPHLPGLAPCGCGDPGCTELTRNEFAPGHDAKRKSILWQEARTGNEAREELEHRGWELPPEIR